MELGEPKKALERLRIALKNFFGTDSNIEDLAEVS